MKPRRRVWKHVANAVKVLCSIQIPIGYWLAQTAHMTTVTPWDVAQVSLWTYVFFSPIDVALMIQAMKGESPGKPLAPPQP